MGALGCHGDTVGGTFAAPPVEEIVDVETLVRMMGAACRAARGTVGAETP